MAFKQYPKYMLVRDVDTDEVVPCGSFTFPKHAELAHVAVKFFKHGGLSGTERLRMNIYTDSACTKLLYQSSWLNLSRVKDVAVLDWMGYVRFDFEKVNINKNITYHAAIECQNYTRNGESDYIAYILDHPEPLNINTNNPVAMAFYGYVEVTLQ